MPLPVLKDLIESLKSVSKLIQKRDPQPSASVIIKLKEVFPSLEFHRAHLTDKTSEGLLVIFPYQWFLLAGAAVPLYKALIEYREKAVEAGGGNYVLLIEGAKTAPIDPHFKVSIETLLGNNSEEVEKVETFLTKYDTWGGEKNIKRSSDFYVSPILNSIGLLAASSGYVVDLCKKLADNPSVLATLDPYFAFEEESHELLGNLTSDFVDSLKGCGFYGQEC